MKPWTPLITILLCFFCTTSFFQCASSASKSIHSKLRDSLFGGNKIGSTYSTAVLRVGGNVYPDGYFYTTLYIGQPPQPYNLDIDTGSDLAWVQCDAPCVRCLKGPHKPYKPRNNVLPCQEPICGFLQHPPNYPCRNPSEQCDYQVEFADHGSSIGVLVKDYFSLRFLNGTVARPAVAFGCGYDQDISDANPPFVDGVLGLANGKSSILSQLHDLGLTRNVFGHCFSSRGGGYLFVGDEVIPPDTVWVPMTENHIGGYYSMGPAELMFGGQSKVKGALKLVIDSGSTYTYLNSKAYDDVLSMVKKNVDPKQLKNALKIKHSHCVGKVLGHSNLWTMPKSFSNLWHCAFQN